MGDHGKILGRTEGKGKGREWIKSSEEGEEGDDEKSQVLSFADIA